MKAIVGFLCFFSVTSSAASLPGLKNWPEFKMAFAHEQKVVTSEMLTLEQLEINAFKNWRDLRDQEDDDQVKVAHAQRAYDRALSLDRTRSVTKDNLDNATYELAKAKNELARLPFAIGAARAIMELYKLRLMDRGNPGSDYRLSMAEASLDAKLNEQEYLKIDAKTAHIAAEISQRKLEHARDLVGKRALSNAEMEGRAMEADLERNEIEEVENRIEDNEMIIRGLSGDVERLKSSRDDS